MTSAQESLKAALTSFLEDAVTAQDPPLAVAAR